jgi:hypothetical protein
MPRRQSGSYANPTQSIEKSLENTAISSVLPLASKDSEKKPASDLSPDEDCRLLTPTLPISDSSFVEVINEFLSTSMAMKKGSSTFYCSDDVQFLRIVLHHQAFIAPYGQTQAKWDAVSANMRMYTANTNPPKQHLIAVTSRGCRSHFESMLAKFRESELISRYASRTEEEYTEIDSLLTDITQLLDDHDAQKKEGKLSAKSRKDLLRE